MNFDRAERRAANAAAWAKLAAEFRALPKSTRDQLIASYQQQKATGATVTWSHFLSVALTMLPSEMRA